jgi:hypothetical protein
VLQGGWTLYFAANNGAEPLYVYLAALSTALFGPSAFALRLPAALAAIARVLATFLLVRAVFRDEALPCVGGKRAGGSAATVLALLAALLQTLSLWHLHLSRDASRVGLFPLLATLTIWLLWEGISRAGNGEPARRRGAWPWFALAGVCLGLAFYTYLPARLLPLLVVALLAHLAFSRRAWLRRGAAGLALGALVAVVVAAPLAAYYVTHWSAFTFRVEMVSLANPWVHEGDPGGLLARNLAGTLGMFALRGDEDPQYNVLARPIFPLPLAALFVLGVAIAGWRLRRPAYWLFLAWLAIMLLPGLLSAHSPHFARQVGIIPAVYVLAALGAYWLYAWARRLRRGSGLAAGAPSERRRSALGAAAPVVVAGGLAAAIVGAGVGTVRDYFDRPPASGPALLAHLATLPRVAELYVAGSEETAMVGTYLARGVGPPHEDRRDPTRVQPRFTQGFHSLLLPRLPAVTLYLVETDWWWLAAEQLLWARYDLQPYRPPPGLERFRVLGLSERPLPAGADAAAPWTPLPPVGWAVGIRLVGYGLPAEAAPGEVLGVTLRWRVERPAPDDPGQDYTFAVGLVDAAGQEVAGRDWLGHLPAAWRDGDEVVSWFDLCLPPTTAPGPYQATVALYSRADFERRPLLDAAGQPLGDHLTFGYLPVHGPAQDPPCGDRVHPALPP